jgi:putative RecB family exonuclease
MPKPPIPDGLYVSVSQMKAFLKCPAFYTFKYVLAELPAFVPVNLAFGAAVHSALAAYYLELKATGQPLAREHLLETFRDAWGEAVDGPVPLQPDDEDEGSLDQLTDKGVSMLHAFDEHARRQGPVDVDAVEHSFSVPLHDPSSGEVLDEVLIGTMDLIIRTRTSRTIVEHKTSAKKYGADQLRWDLQPTAYKLAARESGLGSLGLVYQVLTKTKVPAIQVAEVVRTEADELDFLRTVVGVLAAVNAGVDYPVRGWACRTCPFAHACAAVQRRTRSTCQRPAAPSQQY